MSSAAMPMEPVRDVFVSYSHRDRERAFGVRDRLREAGIAVWMDEELSAGDVFREELDLELQRARVVLVLWSRHSVNSRYVVDEADEALEMGTYFPARLDEVRMPLGFRGLHAIDLRDFEAGRPGEEAVTQLIGRIRLRLGRSAKEIEDAQAAAWRLWLRRLHRARRGTMLSIGAALLALLLHAAGVLDGLYGGSTRLRLLALQARTALTDQSPSPRLRVVLLDKIGEEALSGRPLPHEPVGMPGVGGFGAAWRGMHAPLLRKLADADAKVVTLDSTFGRKDAPSMRVEEGTRELAEAIEYARGHGTAVVIAAAKRAEHTDLHAPSASSRLDVDPLILAALEKDLGSSAARGFVTHPCVGLNDGVALLMPLLLHDPSDPPASVRGLALATIEALYGATLVEDADGSVAESQELRLVARATRQAGMDRSYRIKVAGRGSALGEHKRCAVMRAGQVPVQLLLDRFPQALRARGDRANALPYERILAAAAEAEFRDRAVLVGVAVGKDVHTVRTCSGLWSCGKQQLPGVAIHAATLESLLSGRALRTLSPLGQLLWLLVFCAATVWLRLHAADRNRPRWPGLVGVMTLDLLCTIGAAVFLDLLTDGLYHLAAIAGTHFATGALDRRYGRRIRTQKG